MNITKMNRLLDGLQAQLDRGVEFFDREGGRLSNSWAIIDAYLHGRGLTAR